MSLNWQVGTKVSTAKGEATVIDMTPTKAIIQFLDGATMEIPYRASEDMPKLGSNKVGRLARPKAPKAPKAPKDPKDPKVKAIKQEKESVRAQKKLSKVETELAEMLAQKARLDALKAL